MGLLVLAAQVLFLGLLWLLIWCLAKVSWGDIKPVFLDGRDKPLRFAVWLIAAFFIALAGYQTAFQFGRKPEKFLTAQRRYDRRPVLEERKIEKGRILDRNRLPLATFQFVEGRRTRYYPLGPAAGHVTGYSSEKVGRSGLEAAFGGLLAGRSGETLPGMWSAFLNKWLRASKKGEDLITTIDSQLQKEAYEMLGAERGAVVAMIPETGEVLVLASKPSYDPNKVGDGAYWAGLLADKYHPFFNRAVTGLYPPGSTFKIITAAAGLEKAPGVKFECSAEGLRLRGTSRRVKDYDSREKNWRGHGRLDLADAVEESCNNYFAQLSLLLGEDALLDAAGRFYFGKTIPWNSANEGLKQEFRIARGELKSRGAEALVSPLSEVQLAWSGIGQAAATASPMQMCLVAAAVANGGIMPKPRLDRGSGTETLSEAATKLTARKLSYMLAGVVKRGTGRAASAGAIAVAGKTGTAETFSGPPHSWFVGFAPADKPRIAFAVIVEHGGTGGGKAATIAGRLMRKAAEAGYFR